MCSLVPKYGNRGVEAVVPAEDNILPALWSCLEGPPGPWNMACNHGSARNLGDLIVSIVDNGFRASRDPSPRSPRISVPVKIGKNKRHCAMVSMFEETKDIEMGGEKSECLHSTNESGEPARGTQWREGGRRVTEPFRGHRQGHWALFACPQNLGG